MIPILFAPDEKDFTSNGLGRLSGCRRFEVTEERNGIYECQFEYPTNGPLFSQLKYGYYVYAIHDDSKTPQPFEIYSREATMDGWALFRAWHISYQLNDIIVKPFSASGIAQAITMIPANEITPGKFTFWTDKTTAGDFELKVPTPARALLGGSEGSLLDVFGSGDYEFDMYQVKLYTDRGSDHGVSIRYGKNLVSLDHVLNGGNIANGAVPFWQSADGEVVYYDGAVYADGAIAYITPLQAENLEVLQTHVPEDIYAKFANLKVQALDLSADFIEKPTPAQLADRAREILAASKTYELEENITIDFVALWQTEEYKNVANLQRVYLCDTVNVFYEKLGISVAAKVIKVTYDALRERYSHMELGKPQTTLADQIKQSVAASVFADIRKTYPDKSMLQNAISHATKMIEGGLGGYVVIEPDGDGYPQEILIMDTPDKSTAVNVWRWNAGGLGHSHTGYNGPFDDVALTADGQINASMITAGQLNADLIRAGIITDQQGENSWNLQTGQFVTQQGQIGEFYIDTTSLYSGSLGVGETGTEIKPGMFTQVQWLPNNTTRKLDIYGGILELSGAFPGDVSFRKSLNMQTIHDASGNPIATFVNGNSETAMQICTNPSDGFRVRLLGGIYINGGVNLAAGTTITIGSSGGVLEFH